MLLWIIAIIILLLLAIFAIGYHRVSPPRQASFEGIESPEAAKAYDRLVRWPQFRALRHLIVKELKRHRPQGTLADVGCGPGYLIALIARAFPDLHIVGADISEEMVKLASGNFPASKYGARVEFRQGDVQKLPFADGALDFLVSTLSLHHWQSPEQALKEIHRVLKPGGQFLLFDLRRDSRRAFYWLMWFAQTFIVPEPMREAKEPIGSALSAYTPAEMEKLLSALPLAQYKIKPSFVSFMFIWGRKG